MSIRYLTARLTCSQMFKFIYQVSPHAPFDNPWQISHAIGEGIPPATRSINTAYVPALWDLMEACWRIKPSERPTAEEIGHYLDHNVHALSGALEEAVKAIPERHCDPTPTPSPVVSEPLLPTAPDMLFQSTHSEPSKPSHVPSQQLPLAHTPAQSESSNKIRPNCVERPTRNDKELLYYRFYRLFFDSYAKVKAKMSSLNLFIHFSPNRIAVWSSRL